VFIRAIRLFLSTPARPPRFRCDVDGSCPAGRGRHGGSRQGDAGQRPGEERDPRAQFLAGFYIYGNPESKLYDVNKATPLLLDAAERGYVPAMLPIAGAYAEGKGVPKSAFDAYKWVLIAEYWNAPVAPQSVEQIVRELKPDEIEKAKAEALAYTFKTK